MTDRFKAAQADVSQVFASPDEIVRAADLDNKQKVALLDQWEADLRRLLSSADENMAGDGGELTGERLRRVHQALIQLGAQKDPDNSAPTMAG